MSWIEEKSVPIQGDDLLRIIYIRVKDGVKWDENPKKHDIPKLIQSIIRHGFRDAPIWDDQLNKGKGGIAGGNGRLHSLLEMEADPEIELPRGIALSDDGSWAFPLQIGVNADSEAEAIAFAIDHNQLTMMGAGLPYPTMMQIWDDGILKQLTAKGAVLPVSIDKEMLEVLVAQEHVPTYKDIVREHGEPQEDDFWSYIRIKAPPDTHNLLHEIMNRLDTESELEALQYALIAGMERIDEKSD